MRPYNHSPIITSLLALCLLSLSFASACRKNKGTPSDAAANKASSSDVEQATKSLDMMGPYQCQWIEKDKEQSTTCSLSVQGKAWHFQFKMGTETIEGTLTKAAYGFHLQGTLADANSQSRQSVDAKLWKQGGGNLATVLALKDNRLVRITMQKESLK